MYKLLDVSLEKIVGLYMKGKEQYLHKARFSVLRRFEDRSKSWRDKRRRSEGVYPYSCLFTV